MWIGDVKEHVNTMTSVFDHIAQSIYDKRAAFQALTTRPLVVSIVVYNVDESDIVRSRLVRSGVVMISPYKQTQLNDIHRPMPARVVQPTVPIDDMCFVTESEWIASNDKPSAWINAKRELDQFDANYERPRAVGYMSEQERLGHFSHGTYLLVCGLCTPQSECNSLQY